MITPRYVRTMRYLVPVGGALLGGAVGVAAYTAHVLNGPRRPDPLAGYSFTPWEVQVPFEDVSFTADDGVVLRGWWFPQPDSKRVVVGFTGHKGLKQDLLGIGSALWRAGNNVLLFDFRGCGDSDVAPLSLAHNELPDARAAVRYASARIPDAAIGLIGYSMGAAVAILVGGDDPHIRAIVADSSFASIRDVLTHAHGRYRLPAGITVALTDFINRWRYGYHFEAIRPVDAIAGIAPRPILIIHGGTDPLITVDQGYRLYNAARQPKDLWVVEGVGHCGAYFADREVYVDRVAGFFEHCLSRPLLAAVESDVAIHGARHT